MQEVFREVELKMKGAVDHLHHELRSVRTGRASLAILEGVSVDYYGTPTPINQLANLSVADASLIVAQPYDPSMIAEIERAIVSSGLGLNPLGTFHFLNQPAFCLKQNFKASEICKDLLFE